MLYCYSREEDKNMSQDLAIMMFEVLEKRIGNEVVCSEWFFGSPMTYEGVLEEVVPFDKVVINKTIIPFVGERQAIESIVLKGKDKTVYSNPKAANYDRKLEEVALAQEEMLGYSILREGPYGQEKNEKDIKHH